MSGVIRGELSGSSCTYATYMMTGLQSVYLSLINPSHATLIANYGRIYCSCLFCRAVVCRCFYTVVKLMLSSSTDYISTRKQRKKNRLTVIKRRRKAMPPQHKLKEKEEEAK